MRTLNESAMESFDKFVRAGLKCRDKSKWEKARSESKDAVVAAMGDDMRARLPDGRIIQRVPKNRTMSARPAHKQEWEELIEVEE